MPITLEEARKNVQDDLQMGVIDEFRKSNWILDHITFDDAVSPTGGGATPTYSQYANAIIKTATGAGRVNVEDAWTAPVIGLDVAGRSEQVQTTGTQLIPYPYTDSDRTLDGLTAKTTNGHIKISGTTTKGTNFYIYKNIPAGEYKVKVKGVHLGMQLNVYDNTADVILTRIVSSDRDGISDTFVISEGHDIRLYFNQGNLNIVVNIDVDIMMTTPDKINTPFEPYTGGAPSPSPEYPQQIVSTGTVGTGAQLLDFDAWKGTPITRGTAVWGDGKLTLTASDADCFTNHGLAGLYKIPVKPNTKYTLSWDTDEVLGTVYMFRRNTTTNVNVASTAKKLTIATNADDDYITFRFGVQKASTTKSYWNIMLNAGPYAKPWEPYTGGKPAPSAEYPQEMTVRATGENLLDWNKISLSQCNQTKEGEIKCKIENSPYACIYTTALGDYLLSHKGEKITLSCKGHPSDKNLGILVFGTFEDGSGYKASSAKGGITILTIPNDILTFTRLEIRLNNNRIPFTDTTTIISDIMLNAGDKPLPYEPCRTAAATITLTEPLRGIGEYQDRLCYRDGAWGIERWITKLVYDGSEQWNIYDSHGSYTGFCVHNALPMSCIRRPSLCNQLRDNTPDRTNSLWTGVNSRSIFVVKSSFYDDLAEDEGLGNWKAHLASNPLEIITYLDEPTWTPLPDSTQQAINALTTFSGTTHLTITTGGTMPDVTLDYVQDSHKALDQCQEAAKQYADTQIAAIVAALPAEVQAAIVDNQTTKLLQEV